MKTVHNACKLQPNALEITVADQIEQLDQVIINQDGREFFDKTHITNGMFTLITKGVSRLAGKSNDAVFHLKQAMGGGKTHLMVGFGLLAKDPDLRAERVGHIAHQKGFDVAQIAAFSGRNNPPNYFWGEIANQLGKGNLFREYWDSGAKAPDEKAWLTLFDLEKPILILLDEMPSYFHYYGTQTLGTGTIADVVTRAFSNMLSAAQKKSNVCIVVSDLSAAYDTGGKLIRRALDDAKQELGRAEVSITPVNLESNEIYEILRKRLFAELPSNSEISEIASVYASRLSEAAKAKTVERSAESIAGEIEQTYPFHPSFKSIVALFKENEKFKQTRGLMELVSRLLKSVWKNPEDVYLIGAQHFDMVLDDVREKLAAISDMRDVIARDIWDSTDSAHAQIIDLNNGNNFARQIGTLLLTASFSTAVNSVKGLSEHELMQYMIDPNHQGSSFRNAFEELKKSAWYLHTTKDGRYYFSRQENLTKKLQIYAEKAPQNKVDDLIRFRLKEMYEPKTREAYEKMLPLPEMDHAEASIRAHRTLLIISPDGKTPPEVVGRFFENIVNKNNLLILTGDRSSIADIERVARHVYAVKKADNEIPATHSQRKELDERKTEYEQDFQATILSVFDKLLVPGFSRGENVLRAKVLDRNYTANEPYNGERQVIKTLKSDPIKLYTDIPGNFDTLKRRAEDLLFGNLKDMRRTDLQDKLKQNTLMPWLPREGLNQLIIEACQRGVWEDLGNSVVTKSPRPKVTEIIINEETTPDDKGSVRLKVNAVNAGNTPRIYYAEDCEVSEKSPVLSESLLVTNALKIQFLVVDLSGKNRTGPPKTWQNQLILRNKFDEVSRKLELFVAPRGSIKYTLDGSEPRHGKVYDQPIQIPDEKTTVYVFAESGDMEVKRNFQFSESGSKEILIKKEQPAIWHSQTPRRLDSSQKTYKAIELAQEKSIEFEQVTLIVGSSPQSIYLSLGELRIGAEFIQHELKQFQNLLSSDAPVIMSFKKMHTKTGFDLQQFAKQMGIQIYQSEVEQ